MRLGEYFAPPFWPPLPVQPMAQTGGWNSTIVREPVDIVILQAPIFGIFSSDRGRPAKSSLVIKRPCPSKMESLECRACDRSSLSRPLTPRNPPLAACLSPFADHLCPAAFPQLPWIDAPVWPSVCRSALSPAAVAFSATAWPSSSFFSRLRQAITLKSLQWGGMRS